MTGRIINKKKGVFVLGIATAVMLLAAVGLLLGHHISEQRYGLSLAPEVSHELFANKEDRVRLVVRPELLLPYLNHYLPEKDRKPPIGPSTTELFRQLLPREIALLARSDLPSDKIHLTLFANEKCCGPYIQARIASANALERMSGVNWNSEGFILRERGSLVADGTLALAESLKAARQEYWPLPIQEQSATIRGGHLAELVVDNSNGDLLTLFAIAAACLGEDWWTVVDFIIPHLKNLYYLSMSRDEYVDFTLSNFIHKTKHVHAIVDLKDSDTIVLSLSIDIESGHRLRIILSGITYPVLSSRLRDDFNLVLDGSTEWDETQSLIIGNYSVSGMQPILKNIICSANTLIGNNEVMFDVAFFMNMLLQR